MGVIGGLVKLDLVLERQLKFASGNEITAEDVVSSFKRLFLINGATASILGPLGPVFGQPTSPFQVVDGNVRITLPPGAPGRLLLPCLTASVCRRDRHAASAGALRGGPGLGGSRSKRTVGRGACDDARQWSNLVAVQ